MELAHNDPVPLHSLKPHAAFPPDAVRGIDAAVRRTTCGLHLVYTLRGSLDRLVLPANAQSLRRDNLWRHTCFEAFVRVAGEPGYAEFNFSPSGEWAAYGFDAYRAGMRELALAPMPRIQVCSTPDLLRVAVDVDGLPLPWCAPGRLLLALTAVVEHIGGAVSYWSVAHAAGRPDFHHQDGFVVELR